MIMQKILIKNNIMKHIKKSFVDINKIPLIDLEPFRKGTANDRKDVGKQIDEANKNIGFFAIKNSGIEEKFVRKTLDVTEQFFMSPMENKMKTRVDTDEYKAWGYFPRNTELLQRSLDYNKKELNTYLNDINESFNLQSSNPKALFPKRLFPPQPTEFSTIFPQYWDESANLANTLMKAFALGLDLEESFFVDKFTHCASSLRVLHYPEGVKLQPGQFRASEHTDYGALTVLYSTAPGLQVKRRDGKWIDVEIPWGQFVINIGDMMAFWTNDRWVSTPHRVIAKDHAEPVKRFSLVLFHNPNHDALVECIPTCQSQTNPWKYSPVKSGDFIMKKFKASIGEL